MYRKDAGFLYLPYKEGICVVRDAYSEKKLQLPGGKAREFESYENTAVREAKEETGLLVKSVFGIGHFRSRTVSNSYVHVFFGEVIDDLHFGEVNPDEIEEVVIIPLDELLIRDDVYPVQKVLLYATHMIYEGEISIPVYDYLTPPYNFIDRNFWEEMGLPVPKKKE